MCRKITWWKREYNFDKESAALYNERKTAKDVNYEFFRKLERKFGRFAIPNLMYYIIMMYAAGFA